MLDDEQQEDAPAAEADDDAVDVSAAADAGGDDDAADASAAADAGGDDDAVDLADLGGGGAETADEPAVSPEELMEIADAPERWEGGEPADPGPGAASEQRAHDAAKAGTEAAQGGGGGAEAAVDDTHQGTGT